MKLEAPRNSEYAAEVIKLPILLPLEGSDNLLGAPIYGFQSIVDKSHHEGDIGVMFSAETQLSEAYCAENALYRHTELNKDPSAKPGYLNDNRRVRAIKLRGHRSDCLFLPLESLAFTGANLSELNVGDRFDFLNDVEICTKYVNKQAREPRQHGKQVKKFVRVDPKLFPEHIDTENYWRNKHLIPVDAHVYLTQKIHGTSWRGTHSLVLRRLKKRERIAKRLGVQVNEHEWDKVAGSRKVIKDPHNPDQNHFYSSDIWTEYLTRVEDLIPEGYVIYGEIVGYTTDGSPIQSEYTYGYAPGTHELYVYRVAFVTQRGLMVDLSWPQVRLFCEANGLKYVPDLWEGYHGDFVPEAWIDRRLHETHSNALPLGSNTELVDEGVCVRWDGLRPVILKAKSPIFLGHETKMLDEAAVDLESVGSEA